MQDLNDILELMDEAYLNQDKEALEEAKNEVATLYNSYHHDEGVEEFIEMEESAGLDPRDYV